MRPRDDHVSLLVVTRSDLHTQPVGQPGRPRGWERITWAADCAHTDFKALYVAETAFRAAAGAVHEDPDLTERYRALRRASSEQRGGLASTVAHLLAPAEAAAACPACAELLGACALGFEACRRGCAPCCAVGAAACLAAVTCCAQPG